MKKYKITKEELSDFISKNIPILIKPTKKRKKVLIPVFTSHNAKKIVIEILTDNLFKKIIKINKVDVVKTVCCNGNTDKGTVELCSECINKLKGLFC